MSRLWKPTYTYIAIILACLLCIGILARNYYLSRSPNPSAMPEVRKVGEMNQPAAIPSNQQSKIPTLVLALSKHCRPCRESVGFYRKLTVFKNSSPQGLRLVAVLPESKEEGETYLKEYGIGVDAVLSLPLSQMGLKEVPALLLLNEQHKLEESWIGKLSDAQEAEVVNRLKKACASCSLPMTAVLRASPQIKNGKR
jgi:hypothetical protein